MRKEYQNLNNVVDIRKLLFMLKLYPHQIAADKRVRWNRLSRSEKAVGLFCDVQDRSCPEANLANFIMAGIVEDLFSEPDFLLAALSRYPKTLDYLKKHIDD